MFSVNSWVDGTEGSLGARPQAMCAALLGPESDLGHEGINLV